MRKKFNKHKKLNNNLFKIFTFVLSRANSVYDGHNFQWECYSQTIYLKVVRAQVSNFGLF